MPEPLTSRGFETYKGDYENGRASYKINREGDEEVGICSGRTDRNLVVIKAREGRVYSVMMSTQQFMTGIIIHKGIIHAELPEETVDINLRQAEEIYQQVKKKLKPEEKLKEYRPRFSAESEITLFNVLDIDSKDGLDNLLNLPDKS